MPGMNWKLCHLSLNLVVPIGQCFWVKAGEREPQFLCRKKRSTLKAAPNCWQLQPGSMLTQGTNHWSICHVLMAWNSALFSTRNPRFFSGMLLTSMILGWHFRVWVWPRGPWGVWNTLSQHQKVPPEISETCRTVLPRLALKNAPMSLVVVLRCLSPAGHSDGFFLPGQSYGFRA